MRIGILSDIHDNLWNLKLALAALKDAVVLLCCGDLCSPFVIPQLAAFEGDVHVVFGNNDADLYRITTNASKFPNVYLHGEWFESEFDGKRFAMNHFDYIARPVAASGNFDVVCFGHNHTREMSQINNCQLINPGPVMGAKFTAGWEDVEASAAVYETNLGKAEFIFLKRDA